jgi:nitroreductase
MDVLTVIKERRSVRKYKKADIPAEDIEKILEAAMFAPSARNSRPWEFTAVRNRDVLNKLSEVHPYWKMASQASCCIVVYALTDLSEYWQQDCGAAIQNILLSAAGLGYGTCWCGVYPHQKNVDAVNEIVGPAKGTPIAFINMGVSGESPVQRGKYEPEKVKILN